MREQLDLVNALPVYVHTIGTPLKVPTATKVTHHAKGGEDVTLHDLWQYCEKIPQNTYLRRFLTAGALSAECLDMGEQCNVCSSRMSPLPHPHTPGNMWAAKCDYVANLIDPSTFQRAMKEKLDCPGGPCRGCGRFAAEHWIYSHPLVKPCDLFDKPSYTWGYDGVPKEAFVPNKSQAPRFPIATYVKSGSACSGYGLSKRQRIDEYWRLYRSMPGADWWGYQRWLN